MKLRQTLLQGEQAAIFHQTLFLLVVIHNFDLESNSLAPFKADPPLAGYPNAVLTKSITPEFFEFVPRGNSQIQQGFSSIQNGQLFVSLPLDNQ